FNAESNAPNSAPEQGQQDDGNRYAEQPKQDGTSHANSSSQYRSWTSSPRPFRITIGEVVVPSVALALGDRRYSDNPRLSLLSFLEARSATGPAVLRAATKTRHAHSS